MSRKKNLYPILMGDVVSSATYDAQSLSKQLKALVHAVNEDHSADIQSPFTITLGDEFQGVTQSLEATIAILFSFEEECLRQELPFKLHYAFHIGKIDTPINPDIAYEMMGEGLTTTREILTNKKRNRLRFEFLLQDKQQTLQLNRLFEVLDALILNWKQEDFPLILDMIENENNAEVGELHNKNRDQIWKRRKTLMINEYNQLKAFIRDYVRE
ncbi:SatD family protein [Balneola vulgaris]|uniref:SatD family protein n=1 Tax=Balneola vulgaris TaxID=287535 RepID=UPI0003643594|nr:SatD family protein [Balneola vulgaris]